jgi:precorrin-6B methylase 2
VNARWDTNIPDPITCLREVAGSPAGRDARARVTGALDLRPGHIALDVGCGPGTNLGALAAGVA